jgi:hypothetical protein
MPILYKNSQKTRNEGEISHSDKENKPKPTTHITLKE